MWKTVVGNVGDVPASRLLLLLLHVTLIGTTPSDNRIHDDLSLSLLPLYSAK